MKTDHIKIEYQEIMHGRAVEPGFAFTQCDEEGKELGQLHFVSVHDIWNRINLYWNEPEINPAQIQGLLLGIADEKNWQNCVLSDNLAHCTINIAALVRDKKSMASPSSPAVA